MWAAELARAAAAPAPAVAPRLFAGERAEASRPEIGALLKRLATSVDAALGTAVGRAAKAWDQVDSVEMIDDDLEADISSARRRLAAAAHPSSPASRRALALEGLLVVDASVSLTRLVERRLASLLRLRRRSATPNLLPGARPFLDLGAALHEVAEAWR